MPLGGSKKKQKAPGSFDVPKESSRDKAARQYGAFQLSPRNAVPGNPGDDVPAENWPVAFSLTEEGLRGLPHTETNQEWGQNQPVINLIDPMKGEAFYTQENLNATREELFEHNLKRDLLQKRKRGDGKALTRGFTKGRFVR